MSLSVISSSFTQNDPVFSIFSLHFQHIPPSLSHFLCLSNVGTGTQCVLQFFLHVIKVVLIINPVKKNVILIAKGQFYNFKNIVSLTLLIFSLVMLICLIYIYIQKSTERNMVLWNSWQSHYLSDRRHFVWYLMVCTGFTCNKSYKNIEKSKKNSRIIDQKLKRPSVQRALGKQCI